MSEILSHDIFSDLIPCCGTKPIISTMEIDETLEVTVSCPVCFKNINIFTSNVSNTIDSIKKEWEKKCKLM